MGAKSPMDDHGEPTKYDRCRHTDHGSAHRVEIPLGRRECDRGDQQVSGGKRQLIDYQRRHSGEGTEPPPAGERAGCSPAHDNDRNE